ncbi:hypothetical protein NDI52_22100 [Leptolyngbya sp. PL-A3]|uniref:hypothetical protein n=1 Tax=Leptolyngbya sp. PL-A3 TaxID=2933911 RepID=UPI003298C29E
MEHPQRPQQDIDPNQALFIADSLEVRDRIDDLNQKLLTALQTVPKSWLISLGWGQELMQGQEFSFDEDDYDSRE